MQVVLYCIQLNNLSMIIEPEINHAFTDTNFIMLSYIPSANLLIYQVFIL